MTDKPRPLPIPGTPNARVRGCICPPQDWEGPPWTVDGDCPLHGYGEPKWAWALP